MGALWDSQPTLPPTFFPREREKVVDMTIQHRECDLRKKSITASEGKLKRKQMTVRLTEEAIKLWFKDGREGL